MGRYGNTRLILVWVLLFLIIRSHWSISNLLLTVISFHGLFIFCPLLMNANLFIYPGKHMFQKDCSNSVEKPFVSHHEALNPCYLQQWNLLPCLDKKVLGYFGAKWSHFTGSHWLYKTQLDLNVIGQTLVCVCVCVYCVYTCNTLDSLNMWSLYYTFLYQNTLCIWVIKYACVCIYIYIYIYIPYILAS